jgi:hypothetical protein
MLFAEYYWVDQIKVGEVSVTCRHSVHREIKMQIVDGKPEGWRLPGSRRLR